MGLYCGLDFGLGLVTGIDYRTIRDARVTGQLLHIPRSQVQAQQFLVIRKRPVLRPSVHFRFGDGPKVIHEGIIFRLGDRGIGVQFFEKVVVTVLLSELVVLASVEVQQQPNHIELEIPLRFLIWSYATSIQFTRFMSCSTQ